MRRTLPVLLLLLAALGLRAQVVMEEIGALQESFTSAQQAFDLYQFPQALTSLNPLIATLSRWEQGGRLQPSDEALLERALELRGLCEYNVGKVDLAKQDFTRLIQLRPEYPFSQTKAPKIQRFFEDIRSSLTGTLAFTLEPEDLQLALDGRSLGSGVPKTLPVLKGLHVVKASRAGYAPEEREVNVEVGAAVPVAFKLVPNARTIYFFVQPEGTQLLVDGKPVAKAERTASSQPDWTRYAREVGGSPDDLFVIPALYLSPGEHRVTLTRPCHKSREFLLTVVLDKVNNAPGYVKPIQLERRTVLLQVTSHPSGAKVLLDGQAAGITPLNVPDFCIGQHDILVEKSGVGEYRTLLNVTDESPFQVEATLRPSLLWVGLTRNQDVTPRQFQAASDALTAGFQALRRFNGSLAQERNPLLPDTFFTPGVGDQDQEAAVRELCEKYKCQGLLAGKITSDSGKLSASLRLFVPGLPGYDETEAPVRSAEAVSALLVEVDRPLFDQTADQVVTLADLPGSPGPTVVKGLAWADGPQASDVLVAVGSVPTPDAATARAALQESRLPVFKLLRRGQERSWTLKPEMLYAVTPYGGVTYGYRRQWLLARQGVAGAESGPEQFYSRANLACADLNLGRPAEALKDLEGQKAPAAEGFNASSLDYLRAVALVQLGRVEEARPLLTAAAGDEAASLDGLGRVLVEPLAKDLLRQMPPPPPPPPAIPLKK